MDFTSIDRYRVIRKLGEGGMGCVYLAHDDEIKRDVALKVLKPQFSVKPEHVERLRIEAQAPNIINHSGVVRIDRIGQVGDNMMYLVMEYITGETLSERVAKRRGQLSEYEAIPIITQLSSILFAAHKNGIIHRDIKPSNIMLVPDEEAVDGERVKLLDFGIAKLIDGIESKKPRITKTGEVPIGSPRYMSPEQCRSQKNIDGKSDIYSLGILMYEMFVGSPPFEGALYEVLAKHLYEPLQPLADVAPHISPRMRQVIAAMLEKEPAARPSIEELRDTFRQIRRDLRGTMSSISMLAPLARAAEEQVSQNATTSPDLVAPPLISEARPADSREPEATPTPIDLAPSSVPTLPREPPTWPTAPTDPNARTSGEFSPTAAPIPKRAPDVASVEDPPSTSPPPSKDADLRSRPTQPMGLVATSLEITAGRPASPSTIQPQRSTSPITLWGGLAVLAAIPCALWICSPHTSDATSPTPTSDRPVLAAPALVPSAPAPSSVESLDLAPPSAMAASTTKSNVASAAGSNPLTETQGTPPQENPRISNAAQLSSPQSICKQKEAEIVRMKGAVRSLSLSKQKAKWTEIYELWMAHFKECQTPFDYVEMGHVREEEKDYILALTGYQFYERDKGKKNPDEIIQSKKTKAKTCSNFLKDAVVFKKSRNQLPHTADWNIDTLRRGAEMCEDNRFLGIAAEIHCAQGEEKEARLLIQQAIEQPSQKIKLLDFIRAQFGRPSPCFYKQTEPELRIPELGTTKLQR